MSGSATGIAIPTALATAMGTAPKRMMYLGVRGTSFNTVAFSATSGSAVDWANPFVINMTAGVDKAAGGVVAVAAGGVGGVAFAVDVAPADVAVGVCMDVGVTLVTDLATVVGGRGGVGSAVVGGAEKWRIRGTVHAATLRDQGIDTCGWALQATGKAVRVDDGRGQAGRQRKPTRVDSIGRAMRRISAPGSSSIGHVEAMMNAMINVGPVGVLSRNWLLPSAARASTFSFSLATVARPFSAFATTHRDGLVAPHRPWPTFPLPFPLRPTSYSASIRAFRASSVAIPTSPQDAWMVSWQGRCFIRSLTTPNAPPRRGAATNTTNSAAVAAGLPQSEGGEPQSQEPVSGAKRSMKTMIREYGPIVVVVYFILSTTTFIICFSSITFLGVNEHTIMAVLDRAKAILGFKTKLPTEAETEAADASDRKEEKSFLLRYLPEPLQKPWLITVLTNVLLAMAMTKLFIPIKVGVVLGITPSIAKKLRSMGFDFGKRGYREMAKDAKGRIADRAAERAAERVARMEGR
ncbi:hypothetical protein HK101_008137 [Irineochytrium annulatum]|nr:hypothetical protein HK101_008137 [Irineochytrium annulatum]